MLINKKALLTASLLSIFQLSCSAANNNIPAVINNDAFQGFLFTPKETTLSGYTFKTNDMEKVKFASCQQTLDYKISNIAEYNYFRFKLLVVACKAVNQYKTAQGSTQSLFPVKLDDKFYENLPALTTPYLSRTEYLQRKNKTIKQVYKTLKVSSKNNTATIITNDDEIYITVLARGDFNNDKIEDLLVTSEWYAKHANGKHTELVVLSKTGKNKAIQINWRMNTLK